uniref:Proteasome subunit alpha type-2 n=1 Tax=Populus alba TaxID=43335 RepID=A0A4U5R3E8_POPAL|nr:Proteasome subunit alpha type-2 [Populus alba]TKS18322.1 Proteasome subunit alpha type-2 [Populus alba]
MGDSQYSFSLTSFSPTGKLVQIEHALTAVGSGQTSLGIKAANGVVIATEKKLPSILVDESSWESGILIEALQPPSDLEYLSISSYGGLDLPNWMMTLTRLQALELHDCTKLEVLPPLGRLPNLESLVLRSMKVRRLDGGFLGIEKDENASINEGEIARVTAFPKLKKLTIWNLEEACRRVGWN